MKALSQRPRPGAFCELHSGAARQLNRNNECTGRGERASYRSSSCTDVENKVTGKVASVRDDTTIESMPPPLWPADRGHGGPSPSRKSWVQP